MTEKRQEQSEHEEEAVTAEEEEELTEEEASEDSGKSKLTKEINKRKRIVKKAQKKVKQKLLAKLQILIAALLFAIFLSWGTVEKVLQWASGQEEITVVSKNADTGCLEIVTSDEESFCVDRESFDIALVGNNYLISEYQYDYKLRMVR